MCFTWFLPQRFLVKIWMAQKMEYHFLSEITESVSHSSCWKIKGKGAGVKCSCIGGFATYWIKRIEYVISVLRKRDVMPCKLRGCSMDEQVKSVLESPSVTGIWSVFVREDGPGRACAAASLSAGAAVAVPCAPPLVGSAGTARAGREPPLVSVRS